MTMKARRLCGALLLTVASVLWSLPGTAQAAPTRPGDPEGPSRAVLQAMERDLHLDATAARRRLADEAAAAKAEAALVPALGSAYAGSWFDAESGKLVVGITDTAHAQQVREGGAIPKATSPGFGLAELNAIKGRLDALAKATPSAAAGVLSWHVDPVADRVVVTILAGRAQGALAKAAAAAGPAVRFETATGSAVATVDDWTYVDGGEGILSGSEVCSLGYNARLTYPDLPGVSDPVIISAGHCLKDSTAVSGFGNSKIYSYSLGRWWMRDLNYDWGIIGSLSSRWMQGPWISQHRPDDIPLIVHGTQQRPIGSSVCKSGRTTNITCGVIRWRGESVNQTDLGRVVFNLTRDTTCTEPGDSGGPHYSGDYSGNIQAQGIGSTSQLTKSGRCLQTIGQENRSWYVEIGYIQSYTGARILTG
ncbi:S1 family peptidase [Streptomyces melanogenes]|uniref:S1 family peptidase n=1 Tax=Streptomyces melanogenes TaxID=67326 RepID=UPI00167D2EA7|nr:S1 family peptidase [Streptomyces melanogenes]